MLQQLEELTAEEVAARYEEWNRRLEELRARTEEWAGRMEGVRIVPTRVPHGRPDMLADYGLEPGTMPGFDVVRGDFKARFLPSDPWMWGANGRVNVLTDRRGFVLLDMGEDVPRARWVFVNRGVRDGRAPMDEETFGRIVRDEDVFG